MPARPRWLVTTVAIAQLLEHVGESVCLQGWVTHHRSSGRIDFVVVRDGSGVVQCVIAGPSRMRLAPLLDGGLGPETVVAVTGWVRADARAPGGVEMAVENLEVTHPSHDYPITPKEHGIDFLLQHRHLWVRSPRQAAILRIRATVEAAIREFFDAHQFVATDAPILTPTAAEGTTTLFGVDYFGQPAYLSQSGQLYLEALAMALGRVYALGPTFRAERSKTRRHLIEFWMAEAEMAFCTFEENLRWQENLVAHVVASVLRTRQAELKALGRATAGLERVQPPFPRLTYEQALERLAAAGLPLAWGEDLGAPHEKVLASQFEQPVFITHFPAAIKAFYMQPDPDRPEVVLAADLLAPEGYGEIIGGSQRIHDLALLEQRMAAHRLANEAYAWYLDLRRWGSVPHSGFGLGIERLVAWIAGLDHVREAIPFPRLLHRLYP